MARASSGVSWPTDDRPSPAGVVRSMLPEAGGLANLAGLTRRWGCSKSTAWDRVRRAGFPVPVVYEGGSGPEKLWFLGEVDAWTEARL